MKSYETVLEMYSKQLTSLSSYTLCTEDLFSDQIYNIGRIQVCFFVTQQVYPRLPKHEQFAYGLLNSNKTVQIILQN